jgi:hypothetical protein
MRTPKKSPTVQARKEPPYGFSSSSSMKFVLVVSVVMTFESLIATAENGAINARQWARRACKDVSQIGGRRRRSGRCPPTAHLNALDHLRCCRRLVVVKSALPRSIFHQLRATVLVYVKRGRVSTTIPTRTCHW